MIKDNKMHKDGVLVNEEDGGQLDATRLGLEVFIPNNTLKFFSIESLLKKEVNENNFETYINAISFTWVFEEITSPDVLFKLMSLLPKPAAKTCKEVMDRDNFGWKISFNDVLMVFLNWGATLKSLDVENVFKSSSSIHSFQLESCHHSSNTVWSPGDWNVLLVLQCIAERLPSESEMPVNERALLLRLLMYAAIDNRQRGTIYSYRNTMCSVLNSFHTWTEDLILTIVDDLRLNSMELHNSSFVCCSLFTDLTDRLKLVSLYLCHHVLHEHFDFTTQVSFSLLVDQLYSSTDFLNRFTLWQIFIITGIVHVMLKRHTGQSQKSLEKLYNWALLVRNNLNTFHYKSLQSGFVRELLSRLTSTCITMLRTVFNRTISFNQLNSPY